MADDLFGTTSSSVTTAAIEEEEGYSGDRAQRQSAALDDWNALLHAAFSASTSSPDSSKSAAAMSSPARDTELQEKHETVPDTEELAKLRLVLADPTLSNRQRDIVQRRIALATAPSLPHPPPLPVQAHVIAPALPPSTSRMEEEEEAEMARTSTTTMPKHEEEQPVTRVRDDSDLLYVCKRCKRCVGFVARRDGALESSACAACGCEMIDHVPDAPDDDNGDDGDDDQGAWDSEKEDSQSTSASFAVDDDDDDDYQ